MYACEKYIKGSYYTIEAYCNYGTWPWSNFTLKWVVYSQHSIASQILLHLIEAYIIFFLNRLCLIFQPMLGSKSLHGQLGVCIVHPI